jgi:hypothetical protein
MSLRIGVMDKDIVLKSWEVFQGLARGLGDSCWKIRSVFYTASSALVAYAFVHSAPTLYLFAMGLSVAFFLLESGYKQVQDQYISKSLAIERTLNDLLVDEPEPFIPEGGISTSITTPTIKKCFTTLKYRNWFFWLPYLIVALVCLAMWCTGVSAHEPTPKIALVTDSTIDSKNKSVTVQSVPLSQWEHQWTRIADSLGDITGKIESLAHNVEKSVPVPPGPTPAPRSTSGDNMNSESQSLPGHRGDSSRKHKSHVHPSP